MVRALPTLTMTLLFGFALGVAAWRAPVLGRAPVAPLADRPVAELADTLFDHGDYAYARAQAALAAGDGDAAADWARRSLFAAPMNAYAALALSWGEAARGRKVEARAALERSYNLAPRHTGLAFSRAAMAQRWWPEMTEAERLRTLEEIRVAHGLDAHRFNLAAAKTPRLSALHALAMETPEARPALEALTGD